MKIFLESNIVKEKRDFLKENDIVFEILTIVKKAYTQTIQSLVK